MAQTAGRATGAPEEPLEVLAHPDPFVLEAELLERISRAQETDPLAPVLVVVPTGRLARHVARRIAQRDDARLAVEVMDHRGLAFRALDAAGAPPLRVASPLLLESLLDRVLDGPKESTLLRFLRERPGARRSLLGTLRDLREAGVAPAALSSASPRGDRALAAIYERYARALDGLAADGTVDDAGLVAATLPHLASFAARYREVLHHGAYDLNGAQLDLLRTIDAARTITFLLPGDPDGPASRTAAAFARDFLTAGGGSLRRLPDRPGGLLGGTRLAALYDEGTIPAPLPRGAVRFHHAQGGTAELALAARLALRGALDDGVPPHEIAIVARSLEPYAAAIEEVLDAEGIPWSGPVEVPLRRDPAVRDLLLLLRVAAEDFPRAATAELLASPRLSWRALVPDEEAPRGDLAERWSRGARIVGGLEAWRRDLPAEAGSSRPDPDASDEERAAAESRSRARRRTALRMVAGLAAIARAVEPGRERRWSEHADRVERSFRELLRRPEGSERGAVAEAALLGVLDDLRRLETVLGDTRPVPLRELVRRLEGAVDDARVPLRPRDGGGIRVLDVMQARGLTFRRTIVVGMHAGLFPRAPRADPFVGDDLRRVLRETTGRPLLEKRRGESEERLLLAVALGSCSESLAVSWQRSDDDGKSRSPSIALREVARVTLGTSDLDRLTRTEARGIPAHPEEALVRIREETGFLTPAEATLLLALRARRPADARIALGARATEIASGLRLLEATEGEFAPGEARYDGACPGRVPTAKFSVTGLETLGRCPLRFFFRHVLGVRELDDEIETFDVEAREMGGRAHAALQEVFATLHAEGVLTPERRAEASERAAALAAAAWDEATRDLAARLAPRAPVLWSHLRETWGPAIAGFAAADASHLASLGAVDLRVEAPVEATVDFGGRVALRLAGRFDRIATTAEGGTVVSDYKTGRDLTSLVSATEALKGHRLQAPLYRLLAGADRVEFLGVGPRHPLEDGEPARASFDGFTKTDQAQSFDETITVLAALDRAGRFPIRPDDQQCASCPYRRACRHNHPPTRHRHEVAPELAGFRELDRKSARTPFPNRDRSTGSDAEEGE